MSLDVDIEKKFSDFHLTVAFQTNGTHLGILGASGCGKSMTLKSIAGIETPDKGRIVLNNRVLFDSEKGINLKPQQRRVGYLFQSYALFPNMTTAQNVGCALHLPKEQKVHKVQELMEQFHLSGLENHYPHQLSGGQQQRVALCRMLANEPEIILLDEPFSALDTYLREQMQLHLMESLERYSDVVMVTHSRDEVYKLCKDLLIMVDGRSVAMGNTKEMFRKPQLLATARLTGCKNISRCQKMGENQVLALDWGLVLHTGEAVGEDVTHVGIRAHDFHPIYGEDTQEINLVRLQVLESSEDLFEWTVLFVNAEADKTEKQGKIWWKYSKSHQPKPPSHLKFPQDAILVLIER